VRRRPPPAAGRRTTTAGKFRLNLGPHALYCGGPAERALRELDVPIAGSKPNASGGYAVARGAAHALPGRVPLAAHHRVVRHPRQARDGEAARRPGAPRSPRRSRAARWDEWLERDLRQPEVRELIGALVRLTPTPPITRA
jgi:hypothetical protein